MEILNHMMQEQTDLENALMIEINHNEVKRSFCGIILYNWLKRRHKAIKKMIKWYR